ncbi:hypothetical protein [Saccharothrix deserti]|nr:hypothetical protein [Saccharothrix deserti]
MISGLPSPGRVTGQGVFTQAMRDADTATRAEDPGLEAVGERKPWRA